MILFTAKYSFISSFLVSCRLGHSFPFMHIARYCYLFFILLIFIISIDQKPYLGVFIDSIVLRLICILFYLPFLSYFFNHKLLLTQLIFPFRSNVIQFCYLVLTIQPQKLYFLGYRSDLSYLSHE